MDDVIYLVALVIMTIVVVIIAIALVAMIRVKTRGMPFLARKLIDIIIKSRRSKEKDS